MNCNSSALKAQQHQQLQANQVKQKSQIDRLQPNHLRELRAIQVPSILNHGSPHTGFSIQA